MSIVPAVNRRMPIRKKKDAPAAHAFDPGAAFQPFRALCESYPATEVYPNADFRTEWGPIFHRGRLDGSARLLVIGQDPAMHETFVRRILVGEAGQRVQGFMAKLGITKSYVMINTFLYSVASQTGGNKHKTNVDVAAYRNRWIDAILVTSHIEAVVALGSLADSAWQQWKKSPGGKSHAAIPHAKIMHPTADAHGSDLTPQLLASWNAGLASLRPAMTTPDDVADLTNYGTAFQPADLKQIPDFDYPAGLPSWMHTLDGWATRGVPPDVPTDKRRVLTITVPAGATS